MKDNFDCAKADILQALKLAPDKHDVREEAALLGNQLKAYKLSSYKVYRNMFDNSKRQPESAGKAVKEQKQKEGMHPLLHTTSPADTSINALEVSE